MKQVTVVSRATVRIPDGVDAPYQVAEGKMLDLLFQLYQKQEITGYSIVRTEPIEVEESGTTVDPIPEVNEYIIIVRDRAEENQYKTGTVLGQVEAVNPEGAMSKVSEWILDEYVVDFLNKEEDLSHEDRARLKTTLALWVLKREYRNPQVTIYRAAVDENGDTEVITPKGLEYMEE